MNQTLTTKQLNWPLISALLTMFLYVASALFFYVYFWVAGVRGYRIGWHILMILPSRIFSGAYFGCLVLVCWYMIIQKHQRQYPIWCYLLMPFLIIACFLLPSFITPYWGYLLHLFIDYPKIILCLGLVFNTILLLHCFVIYKLLAPSICLLAS